MTDLGIRELPPPGRMSPRQRLAYWRYRALWGAVSHAPDGMVRRSARRVGSWWMRTASPRQRAQVRANLQRIVPGASPGELADLVHEAYVSYARYWIDSFRLHRMNSESLASATQGEGLAHGDAIRDAGQGGIFATAHLGSWDVGARFIADRGWRMVVVAEVVEPRPLFERFVRLRQASGIEVIPLTRGADVVRQLEKRVVEGGRMATLLADRDLTRRGPIVEFFGEPCRLPSGVTMLAQRTGRPVIVGAYLADRDGYRAVVSPPLQLDTVSIYDGTQQVATALEALIARFPDQWHVFVRNWLVDREPKHPVVESYQRGDDWRDIARSERRVYGGDRQRR
ncbi:MAG: phosphatidylinositol mannoside acyltransferase [Nitriliruptoraceae bacterium]